MLRAWNFHYEFVSGFNHFRISFSERELAPVLVALGAQI
jgi:hypothetical protein